MSWHKQDVGKTSSDPHISTTKTFASTLTC